MKKYQLWLERKSYSQHLFNLMKIKYASSKVQSVEKVHKKHASNDDKANFACRYKEIQAFQGSKQNLGDISYAITYKQLRNRKIRLMKTFDIMNENLSMARRLKQTKSTIHSRCQKVHYPSQITRHKIDEKRLLISNQNIRSKKFNKFTKIFQGMNFSKLHKYFFKVEIVNFTKLLRTSNEFSQIWCQISTQKGFSRSEPIQLQNLYNSKFIFPLQAPLKKQIRLKLLMSKGLLNDCIAQFMIKVPEVKQQSQTWFKSLDNRFQIELKLKYDKINKIKPHLSIK